MQTHQLLHSAVLVLKNGRVLYWLPSGMSEQKTPCNTDFFPASATILLCIVSTVICSVSISAFKRKNSFTVIPAVTCVAAAPQSCMCCALMWRDSSLPTKRHDAKPILLKEGESCSTGPSCCTVLSSLGVKNPWLAVNLSVCLHGILQGLCSLLLNFNQTRSELSHFDELFVCKDGSEGPAWAHPSHRVCALLLQNLMA